MSDLKLFSLHAGTAKQLPASSMALEKSLQTLIEKNLETFLGVRFLAIGRVQNAGKLLTVCSGEVRAFTSDAPDYKVIALMQATIVNVRA